MDRLVLPCRTLVGNRVIKNYDNDKRQRKQMAPTTGGAYWGERDAEGGTVPLAGSQGHCKQEAMFELGLYGRASRLATLVTQGKVSGQKGLGVRELCQAQPVQAELWPSSSALPSGMRPCCTSSAAQLRMPSRSPPAQTRPPKGEKS